MKDLMIYMPQGKAAKRNLESVLQDMYLSGDHDPLQVEIGVKGIEEAVKAVRKNKAVKSAVMDSIDMYNEKTIKLSGVQVQKKNAPARYDFTVCNDPIWERRQKELADMKEAIARRETFLKGISGSEHVTDPSTGEIIEIKEPVKTQGETFAIKFL